MRTPVLLAALALLASCSGPRGDTGPTGQDGLTPWFADRGLAVEVTALAVSASRATVDFTLTDDADGDPATPGTPLDRAGVLTAGPVSIRFVLAQLSGDAVSPGPYTAYTTVDDGGVPKVVPESSGTFETVDRAAGRFRYTFAAPLAGFDPARTQTVLAVASRPFDGVTHRARALRSARPAGGAPAARAVVADARCADCHGRLAAHGEGYDAVAQCILCHQPQAADPSTGQPLDLAVMVHRIHRGAGLPSVVAGTPYRLADGAGTTHDYSTVRYPQSIERCDGCHGGAPQGAAWTTTVTFAACTSCHDTTSFEVTPGPGAIAHTGGPQSDGGCAGCHPATGGASPCTGEPCSVTAAHVDPTFDPAAPVIAIALGAPATTPPGIPLQITFTVTENGAPRNILTNPFTALRATMAGPNGGFVTLMTVGASTNPFAQVTIQGSGATGTLSAIDAAAGVFQYTFPATAAVPPIAAGSWTVGVEGYLQTGAGRYPILSPVRAFAVTDAEAVPRRTIVDPARCDGCHHRLQAHGDSRRGFANCTLCHGPANANADRVSRFEGPGTVLAESVDLRVMIHRIHMGERLAQPYRLGGNPAPTIPNPFGTQIDFTTTRMPRSPAECDACHTDPAPGDRPSWTLPIDARTPSILEELTCTEDVSADTDSLCEATFWNVTATISLPPETAACTGCHDQPFVAVHAQLASTPAGEESCATCHGPGALYDPEPFHRR